MMGQNQDSAKWRARFIATFCICVFVSSSGFGQKIAGPLIIEPGIAPGYTLFAPLNFKTTYLIDNCGRVINSWQSGFFPGNTAYLMPNGNLVRTTRLPNSVITGGGGGGGVEMYNWQKSLIWSFELNNDSLRLHHDVAVLPNGNILMIVWELRSQAEALAAGRNPALSAASGVIWSERIIEVKPILPNSFQIVWQWSLWDHLIQDYDDTKAGFGVVADHPELLDINYVSQANVDWIHANAIDYNPQLDQIVLSSPFLNEFWIIDHSTTTAAAATHQGGNSNKGGDLIYRWGNPLAYKRGSVSDQKLFGQHNVHWVKEGEHAGKIMLFNNNKGVNFSSIDVIDPPNVNWNYELTGSTYGPAAPDFVFTEDPKERLFSNIMAGAQALPNGNLLICSSRQGIFYEVTPEKDTVWFYKSPVTTGGIVGRDFSETDPNFNNDLNFRALKYAIDYPAFQRELTPGEPIEGEPWASCALVVAVENGAAGTFQVFPNPFRRDFVITSGDSKQPMAVSILTLQGKEISSAKGTGEVRIDLENAPNGIYILSVNNVRSKIWKVD
jgi:hypothetical protein